MSKPKTHLANSDEPLDEGVELTAVCGEKVPRAQFVFMWDELECGMPLNIAQCRYVFGICPKCRDNFMGTDNRYLYGVRSWQEEQTPEEG
jgi:hypothetical protein